MATALSYRLHGLPKPREETRNSGRISFHVVVLTLAVALGVLLQFAGPQWLSSVFDRVRLDTFGGLSALLVAFVLAVALHELGHFVAAVQLGFTVLAVSIGPWRFVPDHDRWRVDRVGDAWFSCSVAAIPFVVDSNWRRKTMTVVAAGPALTLAAIIVSLGLLFWLPAGTRDTWPAMFLSASAEVNFFLLVMGLVPNGATARVRNDAALFQALKRNGKDCLDMKVCHLAMSLELQGERPGDYPEELMLQMAEFDGRPFTNWVVARRMVEWAVDCGDLIMAGAWDRYALDASESCDARVQNIALAESGCFDVLFRGDLRTARTKLCGVDFDSLVPASFAERVRATRLVANDLPHWASAHIVAAENALPQGIAYYDYQHMLLAKLHSIVDTLSP